MIVKPCAYRVKATHRADLGLAMLKQGLTDKAFLVQKPHDPLLAFDDLAGLGGAMGVFGHVAERDPFRPEGAACGLEKAHGLEQGDLGLPQMRDHVRVLCGPIHAGVQKVPHEMVQEGEAFHQEPDQGVQGAGVVVVYRGIDIHRDASVMHVLDRPQDVCEGVLVAREKRLHLGVTRVHGDVDVVKPLAH